MVFCSTDLHLKKASDIVSPIQFIIVVSLFTFLGFVVLFGGKFYPTNKNYQYTVTAYNIYYL